MNVVPFTVVILEAKQYSNVTIAHPDNIWAPLLVLSLDSVGCTLNNSQQWQIFKLSVNSVFAISRS